MQSDNRSLSEFYGHRWGYIYSRVTRNAQQVGGTNKSIRIFRNWGDFHGEGFQLLMEKAWISIVNDAKTYYDYLIIKATSPLPRLHHKHEVRNLSGYRIVWLLRSEQLEKHLRKLLWNNLLRWNRGDSNSILTHNNRKAKSPSIVQFTQTNSFKCFSIIRKYLICGNWHINYDILYLPRTEF